MPNELSPESGEAAAVPGGRERGDWREIERILGRLTGADGATVSGNGRIRHVRLIPSDGPEEAVWGARSALAAAAGHAVPEEEVDTAPEVDESPGRWVLASIQWSRERERSEVVVRLEEYGRCTEGRRACAPDDIERATAEATVMALQEALEGQSFVSLSDLRRTDLAGREAWLAAVSLTGPGRREMRVGVAMVQGGRSRLEAVARAVLDGMNRAFRRRWPDADQRALAKFFEL